MKKKVKRMLMMATTAAMIEQFNKNNILILEELGYEVHVLGNFMEGNPISEERLTSFKEWIEEHHGKWFHYSAARQPIDIRNNVKAYIRAVELINTYRYEFIHCHTPIGSVIARLAAYKTNTRVIYTAHGFHFFKGAPLKNWLLYYPVEWGCSWITDILITLNKEDYERSKKYFHAKKIVYIPGIGIETKKFITNDVEKEKKCKELDISKDNFILLSVGELQKRKNYGIVIKALGEIQNRNITYLIAGKGYLQEKYKKEIIKYNLEDNIKLLGYRTDISDLCEIADCFIHVAFHEGASVAVLEAMASKLPVIASNVRGVRDLIDMNMGGLHIKPKSLHEIKVSIEKMYRDESFRKKCGQYNYNMVEKYDVKNINKIMRNIYENVIWEGV